MASRMIAATAVAGVVALGAGALVWWGPDAGSESTVAPSILGAPDGSVLAAGLIAPTSCEDLAATMRELAEEHAGDGYGYGGPMPLNGVTADAGTTSGSVAMEESAPMADMGTGADGAGRSASTDGTNVQEIGVDEQDIVERVGDFVVTGTQGVVRVLELRDGLPVERGSVQIGQWNDLGLFAVGDDRVAVVTTGSDLAVRPMDDTSSRSMIMPSGGQTSTVALVDLSDPDAPRVLSRLDLEGWTVDARAVDGVLRVAVRSEGPQIDPYAMGEFEADRGMDWENATDDDYRRYEKEFAAEYKARTAQAMEALQPADWQPQVRTTDASGASSVGPLVACDRIGFPTAFAGMGTLTMAVIDATGDSLAVDDATAVVTSGENLYSTPDRVVIASTRWAPCCDETPVPMPEEEPVEVDPFFEEGEEGSGTVSVEPAKPQEPTAPVETLEPAPAPAEPAPEPTADATSEVLPMIAPGGPGGFWGGFPADTDLHVFDVEGTLVTHVASGTVDGSLLNQFSMSIDGGVLRTATTVRDQESTESYVTTFRVEGDQLVRLGQVGDLGPDEDIQAVRFMGEVAYVVTFRRTDPLYVVDLSDPAAPRTRGELKVDGYSAYLHPLRPGQLLGVGQDADPKDGRTRGLQVSTFDVADPTSPSRIDVEVTPDSSSEAEYDHHAVTLTDDGLLVLPIEQWNQNGQSRLGAMVYEIAADGKLSRRGLLDAGTRYELRPRRSLVVDGTLLTVGDSGVISWDLTTFEPTGQVVFPVPDDSQRMLEEDAKAAEAEAGANG